MLSKPVKGIIAIIIIWASVSSFFVIFQITLPNCLAACQKQILPDNYGVRAFEIIEQIKELPANEQQARVAKFIAENGGSIMRQQFSVGTEDDGLPVIRANGRTITSQLVHEIEGRTP
jgi:hypothetical protein